MRQHVLIVEQNRKTRTALCRLFSRSGVTAHAAVSVESALEKLTCIPSLVVVDMDLPDGSAADVLEAIRAVGLETEIAVIAGMTDAPGDQWIPRFRPDAVFGKPLDLNDLVDWLGDLSQIDHLPMLTPQYTELAVAA
jgi:DNA-binding NtrC family response regulator